MFCLEDITSVCCSLHGTITFALGESNSKSSNLNFCNNIVVKIKDTCPQVEGRRDRCPVSITTIGSS